MLQMYYQGACNIPEKDRARALCDASRHIDSLTFNRIVDAGFDNLTEFQQEIIADVCRRQAEFEHENSSMINTILTSYSINGVSMGIDSAGWNVFVQNGVVMQRAVYDELKQTGLCNRSLGVR